MGITLYNLWIRSITSYFLCPWHHADGTGLVSLCPSHYVCGTVTNWDCEVIFTSTYSWKQEKCVKERFHMPFKVTTFVVIIVQRVLQAGNSWLVSPEIKLSFMRDKTLNVHLHSCVLWLLHLRSVEAQERETCVRRSWTYCTLHLQNKPRGMIHDETSYWNGVKI
jgi:hypothetical protein